MDTDGWNLRSHLRTPSAGELYEVIVRRGNVADPDDRHHLTARFTAAGWLFGTGLGPDRDEVIAWRPVKRATGTGEDHPH
jgi:hypothetical protein